MCGIAAIFNYKLREPVDPVELINIRDHMWRRGPDGKGEWFGLGGRLGLAHRRLSIIDLSEAGAQPMVSQNKRFVVVFNGEIYNYPELKKMLEISGYVFKSKCDTEILLGLYERYGEGMVHKLRGMYAFIIWDQKKETLFAARDPFGIKPLYYSDDGQAIRFASQVKALLTSPKVDTAPEPAGHVGFFVWGCVPDPFTLYRGIKALPAGHYFIVREDKVGAPQAFCSIPDLLREGHHCGEVDLSGPEQLSEALRDTVRKHLLSDVPVGIFLSSGIDSTTLTALVTEYHPQARTVTLGFKEYQGTHRDEVPLAEKIAKKYSTNHQTVWVTKNDFEQESENLFQSMDQPSTDGVNSYFVSLAAKRSGLKVALSGLGGDEVFGGYPSFRDVPRMARLFGFARYLPGFGQYFRVLTAGFLKKFTSSKFASLLEYGGTFGGSYLLRRSSFLPWELTSFLDGDFVRMGWERLNVLSELEGLSRFRGNRFKSSTTRPQTMSDRLRVTALEMTQYMRNQLLRDCDWASMAHSLEVRVPFVDLTFINSLIPSLRSHAPFTKRDMASTSSMPVLPEIYERAKTGFTVPVRDWLFNGAVTGPLNTKKAERGLRGWSRIIYQSFQTKKLETSTLVNNVREVDTRWPRKPERILVYRIGQLGDTIVSLPSMWAIRKEFPQAQIDLLRDAQLQSGLVTAEEIISGCGIFDGYYSYPVENGMKQVVSGFLLGRELKRKRYDTLVYLAPSYRTKRQVKRDHSFFKNTGILNFIGMGSFPDLPQKISGNPLPHAEFEAVLLLERLAASGIKAASREPDFDLNLGIAEAIKVQKWVSIQGTEDMGRPWIGICPGSKMSAKRWPLARYIDVVAQLIKEYDIWPVVFGGKEDHAMSLELLKSWGRGYTAAGPLDVRSAAYALQRCVLYLGNDTGTMHLAAAAGTTCVAIFSARDRRGLWYPYGPNHVVFRTEIDCEGCGLVTCVERANECLNRIQTDDVVRACSKILEGAFGGVDFAKSV